MRLGVRCCHDSVRCQKFGGDRVCVLCCAACCRVVQEGIDKFFEAAQAATAAMEEATPLLEEAALLTKEITPLLQVSVDNITALGFQHVCEVSAHGCTRVLGWACRSVWPDLRSELWAKHFAAALYFPSNLLGL